MAACEVPLMSYGPAACFSFPWRRDAIFIHYGNQNGDVLQGRPWFPHQWPQGSAHSDGGETFQLHCATAAVGQQLVTVSDKYRHPPPPPPPPLQLHLPPAARRGRKRPHHLGVVTIFARPRQIGFGLGRMLKVVVT